MIKNFFGLIVLLSSVAINAQNGTSSVYSYFGIGDVTFKGTTENRSMAGVSVFSDSTHINLQNPASFAGLKVTSFTMGGSHSITDFTTNTAESKSRRSSVEYLALGFPISPKLGAGFGIMPYSSVGYKIQHRATDLNDRGQRYFGNGGLNKVFFAAGYKLTSKINVGMDLQYNFGEIQTTGITFLPGNDYGSRELNTSDMSGLSINTSLMFKSKLKNKMDIYGSFVFTPESNLKLGNARNIATILYSEDSGEVIVDPLDIDVKDGTIKLPMKVAFGAGIGVERKWLLGTEITLQQSESMTNRFDDIDNGYFENGQKYSLGGYYIPNYNSFTSYLARITYRGGLRYEKTGLVVNDKSIDDMAVTAGLGLPLRGTFSNINIGFEFGKRGTKAADLVRENYKNISISLTLNDLWFRKSKYD